MSFLFFCSFGTAVIGEILAGGTLQRLWLQVFKKFLPAYVMFCSLLGILDFPHQECQLNRKSDKLRELSMHSKQVTMNNKEERKNQAKQ